MIDNSIQGTRFYYFTYYKYAFKNLDALWEFTDRVYRRPHITVFKFMDWTKKRGWVK